MKKSILVSLMVVGVMATLIGASTRAVFTDTVTSTGNTFTAGTVDIVANGDADDLVTYSFSGTGCPSTMVPGESCTTTVTVTNASSTLAVDYTVSASITAGAECDATNAGDDWTVSVGSYTDTTDNSGVDDTRHFPAGVADSETFVVTVTLNASVDDDCQGASTTASVTINGTQDTVNPHNATDDH